MITRKIYKKLALNKETISTLSDVEKKVVKGGSIEEHPCTNGGSGCTLIIACNVTIS